MSNIKKTTRGLLDNGLLTFARLPNKNPQSLEFDRYSVTLIKHDYAAKTPIMWNALYEKLAVGAGNIMLVGETKTLPEIFEAFYADEKYLGGGAGVGFKDEVVKYLNEIDPLAEQIGAVNIIVKTAQGKLRGYNTDGLGFAKALNERFMARQETLVGKKILLLGSGGTANAIAFALADQGAQLTILNRTVDKAQSLAIRINEYFNLSGKQVTGYGGESEIIGEVENIDGIVNVSTKGATGLFEAYSALAPGILPNNINNITNNLNEALTIFEKIPKQAILCDVVLRPDDSPFLAEAKRQGFETLDGIPMVVYQGVEAFWLIHEHEMREKNIKKEQVAEIMKNAAGF